ncbi:helix-turn-helix transcriptional regulator [bacterium]|nr:helix-turn-helix transcriptional regulator [bacterium]
MGNLKVLFGRKIKEYRKIKHITQVQLAELVNVDDKHISCIENGKSFPSPNLISKLAEVLEVEPKDLFEFYYLQDPVDLRSDIVTMLDDLSDEDLTLAHKYIRSFLIK